MVHPDVLSASSLRATVATFCHLLGRHAAAIDRLNVYPVPDGDTGTNMARTLDAVVAELEQAGGEAPDMTTCCAAIAHGSLMGARGNSGVILSQLLRGFTGVLADAPPDGAGPVLVAQALRAAAQSAVRAVQRPVEGTILTVARDAADGAVVAADAGGALADVVRAGRDAGRASLARTPELLPVLADAGVVDAGGAGLLLLFDAALHVVAGEPPPDAPVGTGTSSVPFDAPRPTAPAESDVASLRYEVMFLMHLADDHIDEFRTAWARIGDSIVVVGGDGLWNCHVHTLDVGAAIEVALDVGGRPHRIRVTDLFDEVADEHAHREAELLGHRVGTTATSVLPAVTCAVVAVASGDGLVDLFGQLGVQGVVAGGQTVNPSTAELLAAVEAVNAEQVVVLPNNKNIVPVAEQLDALTARRVVVVPTASMPEALAALVVYDPEADAATNADEMAAAAASVATGEVTQAVRDSASPSGPITAGDWIGIVRGDGIAAVSGSMEGAAEALLDRLVTADRELVTVLTGAEATTAHTDALLAWLDEHRPAVQVEVLRGGQPLYPYLFGVE